MRKFWTGLGVGLAATVAFAGTAAAHDCVNLNRKPAAAEQLGTVRGNWLAIGEESPGWLRLVSSV